VVQRVAKQLPVGLAPTPSAPIFAPANPPPGPQRPLSAIGLLTAGGDGRIRLDETTGKNQYGCRPFPDERACAFGSSTASVISVDGFSGAERLTERLSQALAQGAHPAELYAAELARIRSEFLRLLGVSDLPGLKTLIARSGTDLHRIVAQLIGLGANEPPLVIACEPAETGSGVAQALGGLSSAAVSLRSHVSNFRFSGSPHPCQIVAAAMREPDGQPRAPQAIDEEVQALASAAASLGRRVLLVLMDVSKTGLISPSIGCALDLKQRFPSQVEVLVDACQLRIAPPTLRAYLNADFMVAATGSKFMTGPTFSGALLMPDGVARRLSAHGLPMTLAPHTARADWPTGWPGADALPDGSNFGLVLRWQAALDEMTPFMALEPGQVRGFFDAFAAAAAGRMEEDPAFERLAQPTLDRAILHAPKIWDDVQTIHPFVLNGPSGPISAEETLGVHRLMAMDLGGWARAVGEGPDRQAAASLRVQLGQPVSCGQRAGAPVSALRLCASARLAVDALGPGGRGPRAIIDDALAALDKAAWLARRMTDGASAP
jgi:hypothetical protein